MTLGIGDLLNVVCHHISIFDCENDASLTAGMSYRMYTFFEAAFETVFFKGRGGGQDNYYYATMLLQAQWTSKKQQERQG